MIIDFRMRPPFKSFTKMGGLFGPEGSVHCFPLNGDDAWPVPSADNLDMNQYLKKWMKRALHRAACWGADPPPCGAAWKARTFTSFARNIPASFSASGRWTFPMTS